MARETFPDKKPGDRLSAEHINRLSEVARRVSGQGSGSNTFTGPGGMVALPPPVYLAVVQVSSVRECQEDFEEFGAAARYMCRELFPSTANDRAGTVQGALWSTGAEIDNLVEYPLDTYTTYGAGDKLDVGNRVFAWWNHTTESFIAIDVPVPRLHFLELVDDLVPWDSLNLEFNVGLKARAWKVTTHNDDYDLAEYPLSGTYPDWYRISKVGTTSCTDPGTTVFVYPTAGWQGVGFGAQTWRTNAQTSANGLDSNCNAGTDSCNRGDVIVAIEGNEGNYYAIGCGRTSFHGYAAEDIDQGESGLVSTTPLQSQGVGPVFFNDTTWQAGGPITGDLSGGGCGGPCQDIEGSYPDDTAIPSKRRFLQARAAHCDIKKNDRLHIFWDGALFVAMLDLCYGCGLEVYRPAENINPGTTIDPDDPAYWPYLRVKVDDLAGCGLKKTPNQEVPDEDPPTCTLMVKAEDLAGCGLERQFPEEEADCTLKVNPEDLAGTGLEADPDDPNGCKLRVSQNADTYGCGIFIDAEGRISVNSSQLAGSGLSPEGTCGLQINAGCGLEIVSDTLKVDSEQLAGDGLVTGTDCVIDVNYGCGLKIDAGRLEVNPDALAGNGLQPSGLGCGLDVFVGCHLAIAEGGQLYVNPELMAGNGLTYVEGQDGDCDSLAVDCAWVEANCSGVGGGFSCSAVEDCLTDPESTLCDSIQTCIADNMSEELCDAIQTCIADNLSEALCDSIQACIVANGISEELCTAIQECITDEFTGGCGISIVMGEISVDRADLIAADGGLEVGAGACDIKVKAGDGIGVGASGVTLALGCGLQIDTGLVRVNRTELIGDGLENGAGTCDIKVKAGDGISVGVTGVSVSAGCGLTISAGQVLVNRADLTGDGLENGSGTCDLKVKTGDGITISGGAVAVSAGCGLTTSAGQVLVNRADLIGNGLTAGSGTCDLAIDCAWIEANCDVKTAIIPYQNDYVALYCTEAPDYRFEDIVKVPIRESMRGLGDSARYQCRGMERIDPRFMHACESGTIEVISAISAMPATIGAYVLGGSIIVSAFSELAMDYVTVKISGIAKGAASLRFRKHTKEQYEANRKFWATAHAPKE